MSDWLTLATELATRPGFDCLHDGNPVTSVIEAYHDPVGFPTQGYGRLLSRVPWEDLAKYPPITVEQALADLQEDLLEANAALRRLSPVTLQPHQRAALVDFIFNCGSGNYAASTLRRVVNRGEFEDVPAQLAKWNKAAGVVLRGLVKRRAAEARMFTQGV